MQSNLQIQFALYFKLTNFDFNSAVREQLEDNEWGNLKLFGP